MRRWIQARAGRLLAGLGLLVAGTVAGCQNTPTLPGVRGPNTNTNIPRTAVNNGMPTNNPGAAGNMGNAGQPNGMNMGAMNNTNNRVSGPPANLPSQVDMNMGAMGAAGATGGPTNLGPPPNSTVAHPIATSNPSMLRPVSARGGMEIDPPPSNNQARPKEFPAVEPISAAGLDRQKTWQKPKAPQMDVDLPALEPIKAPPMPNPRGGDSLNTLGPPPLK